MVAQARPESGAALGDFMTDKKVAGVSGDGASNGGQGSALGWILGAVAGLGVAGLIWYVGFRGEAPEEAPLAVTAPETSPADAGADLGALPAAPAEMPAETPAETPAAPEAATAEVAQEPAVPAETVAAEPAADPPAAPAPEAEAGTEAAMATLPPSFDTVRVDADGSVLVAGRAAAGAMISILVDGAEAASSVADARGTFAALFTLMPSEAPRVMTLVTPGADGAIVASEAEVIVAPFAAPVAVASVPPEPAPETTAAPQTEVATAEPEAAPEPAAGPEILIVDAGGVRKQTEAVPVANIVIDTIGYGAAGEVEITGRGRAGAFARLYLDNVEADTVPIGAEGGWRAALAGVAAGIYTLRVDQIDGTGKVSSRFETPFQREAPETVAAALQSAATPSPEPGAAPAPPRPESLATAVAPAEPEVPAVLPQAGTPEMGAAASVAEVAIAEAPAPSGLAAAPDAPASPSTKAVIVTVQPGFSLWRIARENYGEGILYVKVYEANKDQIRDPDLIYPGQIFTVPGE